MDWTYHDGRGSGYRIAPHARMMITGAPLEVPDHTRWVLPTGTHFYPAHSRGPELQVYGAYMQHRATHKLTVMETDAPHVTDLCDPPEQPEWRVMEMQPPRGWAEVLVEALRGPTIPPHSAISYLQYIDRAAAWVHSVLEVEDYHHQDTPEPLFVVRGRYHLYRAWYWERVQ